MAAAIAAWEGEMCWSFPSALRIFHVNMIENNFLYHQVPDNMVIVVGEGHDH